MKNALTKISWGILFILIGIVLAGKALNLFDFNLFFRGWWTLFIIIPCAAGVFERGHRTSSFLGLGIGVLLLLFTQGLFGWFMFFKIMVSYLFIVVGFSLIFKGNKPPKYPDDESNMNYYSNTDGNGTDYDSNNEEDNNGEDYNRRQDDNWSNEQNWTDSNSGYHYEGTDHSGLNRFTAILGGRNVQYVDEVFTGAVISSILGNVQFDLRNAIIDDNVVVELTCILGGVDIFVPHNIKVVVACDSILADVDRNVMIPPDSSDSSPTLFIKGTCILGGIQVK